MQMTEGTSARVAEAKARARAAHGDLYLGCIPRAEDGRYSFSTALIARHGLKGAQHEMQALLLAPGNDGLMSEQRRQAWLAEVGL